MDLWRDNRLLAGVSAQQRCVAARQWVVSQHKQSRDQPLILLVPSRVAAADLVYTALAEDRADAPDALCHVYRYSLEALADKWARDELARRHLTVLSGLATRALLVRAVHEQRAALGPLARIADTPGFVSALGQSIEALRLFGLAPTATDKLAQDAPDLSLLYRSYLTLLDLEQVVDRAGLLWLAAGIEPPAALVGARMLLVDLPVHDRCTAALVAQLAQCGLPIWATVAAGDSITLDALAPMLGELTEAGAGAKSRLAQVQRGVFELEQAGTTASNAVAPADESLVLMSAPSPALECVEVARRVRRLCGQGLRGDAIAVLLRRPKPYAELIAEAFGRAGLPAYFAAGARRPDPSGRALVTLLRFAAEGLPAHRFAEYLSLSQLPASCPAESERPHRGHGHWERLIDEAGVVAGRPRWRARLAELDAALRLRLERLDDPADAKADALRADRQRLSALQAFVLPLVDRLSELPPSQTWGEWLRQLLPLAHAFLAHPERVAAVLQELGPLSSVGPVDLDHVVRTLSVRLLELSTEPPDHRYGRVFVATIEEVRGLSFEVSFVVGVAERSFPAPSTQDPLLVDELCDRLNADNPAATGLPAAAARRTRERLALRLALGSASRSVVLSFPRTDPATGQPRVPSFYLLEVARAADGALPALDVLLRRAATAGALSYQAPHPQEPEQAIDEQEYDLANLACASTLAAAQTNERVGYCAHLQNHPFVVPALRAHWKRSQRRLNEFDGLWVSSAAARAELARYSLSARPYAVTSLERFAACPYRFYLHSLLRLRSEAHLAPTEADEGIDPLTRGRLVHQVQCEMMRELKRNDALPLRRDDLAAAQKTLKALFQRIAEETQEAIAPSVELRWQQGLAEIEQDLCHWLERLVEQDEVAEHCEYAFGVAAVPFSDTQSVPQPASVAGYLLRGVIDLVERRTDGHYRITDYKTGAAPASRRGALGGGTSLQRVLYALAYEALWPGRRVSEGRLYYCTERGAFSEHALTIDEPVRDAAVAFLETVDQAIRAGQLPAAPENGCDHCDYQLVCGRDAKSRWRRKERRAALQPSVKQLIALRRSVGH